MICAKTSRQILFELNIQVKSMKRFSAFKIYDGKVNFDKARVGKINNENKKFYKDFLPGIRNLTRQSATLPASSNAV